MASGTLMRRGLIENDRFPFHHTLEVVTRLATHSLMGPLERESGAPLMIEQRRLPSCGVMAIGTRRNPIGLGELSTVNVLMTLFTLGGRRFEIRIN